MEQRKEVNASLQNKPRRLAIILLLGALSAFGPLTIDMYLPAFPTIAHNLGTTASLVQLSLTACLLGLAFGQIIVGPLSDVHGRRKPLVLALSLYALTSILCAFAPSIVILVLLRFMQGAAGAAGMVISRACVRDMYSGSEMTKIFSMLVLVMGAAPIFAPVVGGLLLNYVSWRGIFITLFALSLVMLVLLLFRFPETLPEEKRSKGGLIQTLTTFKGLVSDRVFIGYALTMGLSSGVMFAYISGSPFVLQEIFQVSPQMYSVIFGVNAMGLITASQITGRLAGRIEESRFLMLGLSILLTGSVLLLSFTLLNAGLVPILIALFLVVSSVGFINASGMSLAMNSQTRNAGSASALLGLIQFSIGGMMAPLVGISGSQTAVPLGIVVACCSVCAVVVHTFLIRKKTLRIHRQISVDKN